MWVAKKRVLAILFIAMNVPMSSCGSHAENGVEESVASPCVLAANPFNYSNQRIKLTGYVESTHEGSYIWGDGCKDSGIALHVRNDLRQDADADFNKLFKQRVSPSPPKATLVGTFRYTRWGSVWAVIFGKKAFEADRVLDMQVGPGESPRTP